MSDGREISTTSQSLAVVVKVLRLAAGKSARIFSGLVAIPLATYNRIEAGDAELKIGQLDRIAGELGIPLATLIDIAKLDDGQELDEDTRDLLAQRAREAAGAPDEFIEKPVVRRLFKRK